MIVVTVPHDEEKPNTTGWENKYPNFKFRSDFTLTDLAIASEQKYISHDHFSLIIFLVVVNRKFSIRKI